MFRSPKRPPGQAQFFALGLVSEFGVPGLEIRDPADQVTRDDGSMISGRWEPQVRLKGVRRDLPVLNLRKLKLRAQDSELKIQKEG